MNKDASTLIAAKRLLTVSFTIVNPEGFTSYMTADVTSAYVEGDRVFITGPKCFLTFDNANLTVREMPTDRSAWIEIAGTANEFFVTW